MSRIQYYNINNFGSHISFEKNMKDTVCNCISQNMYSCQIFLGNRLSLNRTKCSQKDIDETNEYFKKWNLNIYSHIPYCINLSGKSGKIAYSDSFEATEYANKCIQSIQCELDTLNKLECNKKGCVVHVGSIGENKNIKEGLNAVTQSINSLNLYNNTPLCLETMVGCGGVLGKDIYQLKTIYDGILNKEGVGICLDTCHLFAQGSYNLRNYEEIDTLFNDYFSTFGLNGVKVVHFNDSKDEFGSKKDRHSSIGEGHIWKTDDKKLHDSCRYFIDRCQKENISIVLETVPEDYNKVIKLYNNSC